jgi:Dolichyl-phosphate-mannose-protein mannosyltransferase
MPAAEPGTRRVTGWRAGLAALVVLALVVRLIGIRTGLPFVYNADENAHFVPLAIGMFGHSLNPDYFVNPPAYTYLLHVAFGLRWGFERAAIGNAFAIDPGSAFTLARVLTAVLGAAAAGLLACAGARLFDRRTGLIAGALFAFAFLPVYYGHLALNDVPALAPLCLALVGVAGVLQSGRMRDFALAGIGLGLGAATKYTEGIVLLPLLTAAALAPVPVASRVRGVVLAGALALGGFLVANPYALLDFSAFQAGLQKQSEASADGGGKLGLTESSGLVYYLKTLTWGLGWLAALAALAGAVWIWLRDRRAALVLVPAPVLFLLFMGTQDRFFARWLLPIYPLLCLLAAWAAVQAATWVAARLSRRATWPVAIAGLLLCAQGIVYSAHNSLVLAQPDTRALARSWMVGHIPEASKVVIEPIAPAQWAMDPSGPSDATATGNRWNKWPTSRYRGKVVKLEDYERTLSPSLVERYRRGGYCWVVSGSTQYGRAFAEPREVPGAIAYYAALRRSADVVYAVSPLKTGSRPVPFSFDFSFNAYPLRYDRPGPQISIYRLRDCAGR